MKIYDKIIISLETNETLYESSFDYTGEIAVCKGGGGGTTTSVDTAYNARMAVIAEAQEAMAEEYFAYWKESYKPYEKAQIAANLELMPGQIGLAKEEISAARELLPGRTALAGEEIEAGRELIGLKMPVARKYFEEAGKGVSVREEMGKARADVESAFTGAEGEFRRGMGRMGVDPLSGRFASLRGKKLREKTAALAGAGTGARRFAESESFKRLREAGGGLWGG